MQRIKYTQQQASYLGRLRDISAEADVGRFKDARPPNCEGLSGTLLSTKALRNRTDTRILPLRLASKAKPDKNSSSRHRL